MTLFRWEAPGPHRVAFSTRLGGVSEGPYESLNLGLLTADAPGRVRENRRRLLEQIDADADRATMAMQVHSAVVRRADERGVATPGVEFEPCDGLWTDEPGAGLMLITADCLPIALCSTNGRRRVCVLHAGWRGLLAGIVEAGVGVFDGAPLAAAVGPAIGPCCYEVGDEVREPFRDRFGDVAVRGRNVDLRASAERALREAGVTAVEHVDLCTACHPALFFSHRRDSGVTGRQGVVARVA